MTRHPRRRILQALAATGSVAAIGGIANARLLGDGDDGGETPIDVAIDPAEPGEIATYEITVPIADDGGEGLETLFCKLPGDDIDRGGVDDVLVELDGEDVTDDLADLEYDEDDNAVGALFDGDHTLEDGSELTAVIDGVENPEADGEYELVIGVNVDTPDEAYEVTITIDEDGLDVDDGEDDDEDELPEDEDEIEDECPDDELPEDGEDDDDGEDDGDDGEDGDDDAEELPDDDELPDDELPDDELPDDDDDDDAEKAFDPEEWFEEYGDGDREFDDHSSH